MELKNEWKNEEGELDKNKLMDELDLYLTDLTSGAEEYEAVLIGIMNLFEEMLDEN